MRLSLEEKNVFSFLLTCFLTAVSADVGRATTGVLDEPPPRDPPLSVTTTRLTVKTRGDGPSFRKETVLSREKR